MLAILISWVIIAFILFTFGDMLLALYNKTGKQNESYNFYDTILLGLSSLTIPVSIWSLWLPSNHIFLIIVFFFCISYWVINYRRTKEYYIQIIRLTLERFSSSELALIIIFILVSSFFYSWQQDVYDSAFYHYQNIKWNEEFPVVPGIANIDDRFGFNSNYFLLSAVFSFRFLLGEAIYTFQSLIVTIIGIWIFGELFKSKYEIKRLIIFVGYILLFSVSIYFLGNTSTDILPNFIVFYIIARIILSPNLLRRNYLICIVIPVFLLTCKLSFFPIGIISILTIYQLIKHNKYKIIAFICTICILIIIPWFVRNVIISGYLIYPLYQIDLFNFDWKVPYEIAVKENEYIFAIGYYFFRTALKYPHMSIRDPFAINILTDIIYLLTFISFLIIIYLFIKKRKQIGTHIYLLYITFFLFIIVWGIGGPDIRFISGILCTIIFTGGILLVGKTKKNLPTLAKSISYTFFIGLTLWTSFQCYNFNTNIPKGSNHYCSHLLLKPFTAKDQQLAKGIDVIASYKAYPINNDLFIWVGSDLPYDMTLPASIHSHYAKFLPIENIEARGNSIQEGFRTKKDCK